MNESEHAAVNHILRSALNDEPWKNLGFPRRPKSGSFWRRLRPAWKNRLEQLTLRQIVSVFTAVAVIGGNFRRSELQEAAERFADAFPLFGYENRNEAVSHLHDTIILYVDNDLGEWQKLLLEQVNVTGLPDEKTASNLVLGAIRFFSDMKNQLRMMTSEDPENDALGMMT
jgi:hypothetical protein